MAAVTPRPRSATWMARSIPRPRASARSPGRTSTLATPLIASSANGRIVFVDVTADWCITCQVNKRFVLEKGPHARTAQQPRCRRNARRLGPAPIQGIADYLASFGRYWHPVQCQCTAPARLNGVALPELIERCELSCAGFQAPQRLRNSPASLNSDTERSILTKNSLQLGAMRPICIRTQILIFRERHRMTINVGRQDSKPQQSEHNDRRWPRCR